VIGTAPFGRTGHDSTRVIFGGAALGAVSHEESERALELLLEYGVNHLDTAPSYGDSELRIASWLKRHPGRFFLATKIDTRDYRSAKEQLHRSLERLGVDVIDLIQLHNLVDVIDWEFALAADGALEAAVEARDEGIVRFIGVTGHGRSVAHMHRRSMERFPFDSVLLPYNATQMRVPRYAEEFDALEAICRERGVAVQTIKGIARALWEGRRRTAATWYEPLTDPEDIERAVRWVLGRAGLFLNTAADVTLLPHVLAAADRLQPQAPPAAGEMEAMIERRAMSPLFA
jgi:aryl-alcohol dehydrogenase-like predicted oxidoreductase